MFCLLPSSLQGLIPRKSHMYLGQNLALDCAPNSPIIPTSSALWSFREKKKWLKVENYIIHSYHTLAVELRSLAGVKCLNILHFSKS